jgi:hypothetical protein
VGEWMGCFLPPSQPMVLMHCCSEWSCRPLACVHDGSMVAAHDEPTAVWNRVCHSDGCDSKRAHLVLLEHVDHTEAVQANRQTGGQAEMRQCGQCCRQGVERVRVISSATL